MAKQYACGKCGVLGHNRRTCERPPVVRTASTAESEGDVPQGPWDTCVAGDPWCPCVGGKGHGT